jgi:hypothetical protein
MRIHTIDGWRVGVCGALMLAAACTRSPQYAVPTVTYLREHDEERRELMKRCMDDPGSLGHTPACVNAKQATIIVDVGSFRSLPPMGLLGTQPPKLPADAPRR